MTSETLHFDNPRLAQALYANEPKNLRFIEDGFKVRLSARDAWINVEGDADAIKKTKSLFDELQRAISRGAVIRRQELSAAVATVAPTFEIHGIMGGFTGEGSKTVIPAVATAKVSLRLVPKLTEKKVQGMLVKAVKAAAPPYADASVKFLHGASPVVVDVESRPIKLIDQAFKEVEGRGVSPVRSGGSIPIVPELAKEGAPVVLSGIGLPDDRLHAPDEKINLEQVWKGVRVFGRFFQLMGEG